MWEDDPVIWEDGMASFADWGELRVQRGWVSETTGIFLVLDTVPWLLTATKWIPQPTASSVGIYMSRWFPQGKTVPSIYKDFNSPLIAKPLHMQTCVSTFQRANHGTAFIPQKMAKSSTKRLRHGRFSRKQPASNVLFQAKRR